MKCPRCQQGNPLHAKFCLECGVPFSSDERSAGSYTDLKRALAEALEQQTATEEILRVISRSPTDLQPVLDTIARNAVRVCGATDALVAIREGDELVTAAHYGDQEVVALGRRRPIIRGFVLGRALLEARPVQVVDITHTHEFPEGREIAVRMGHRTVMAVPLLREGMAIGGILLRRSEVHPFTDAQIALLQTFADQAVIAIENVRLFNETHEALGQQTATSEILRVISRSPTDVQPVFEALAESVMRLFRAWSAGVFPFDGELLHFGAARGGLPGSEPELRKLYPMRPSRETPPGRCILERAEQHVPDVGVDPNQPGPARARGYRALLQVPMLRAGEPVGVISVTRAEAGPFSETEIALLRTFADQAVIAIENVRLFTELQASNRELTTALDTQTATSDILRVISRSQTDVQPVFDAILASAVHLLGAYSGSLTRTAGDQIELAALTSTDDAGDAAVRTRYPQPLQSEDPQALVLRDRAPLNIDDAQTDPRLPEASRAYARARGWRSAVMVPLLRHDEAIGTISVTRRDPGGFTDDEIALLKTFADQAVIAIQNVRLFKELEAKNASLSEALDRQTVTAEILRIISQSQTQVQPVFDTIVNHAMRLFHACSASVLQVDGQLIRLVASSGGLPGSERQLREQSPWPIDTASPITVCIAKRTVVHIPDIQTDRTVDEAIRALAGARGWRSILAAPIMRDGRPVGAIAIQRAEPRPFSDVEIDLLKTFADQAEIALENARLLGELRARTGELTRSVEELTALGDVSRALSSTLDLDTVLQTIVTRANQLAGADACSVFEYEETTEAFHLRATNNLEEEVVAVARRTPIRKGEGVQGRMAVTREPMQVPDIAEEDAYRGPMRDALLRSGTRAVLAIPMLREDQLIGGLTVNKKTPGEFPSEVIELLSTFATQSALAIQNARLFREIEEKSRQLEAASQHKSEFLANMSHELRTPLNAIIGFSEVLSERMFGELNEKQEEYLTDIHASGQHLLSLINDILDLSKIEAGRMELELTDFDLPTAIDNALTLVRERAGRRGIALHHAADGKPGQIRADERKIKQVLLNLLSNAIKFTPEGGRIDVRAIAGGGSVEVSVTDTGVGIAPEDQEAIFEEFRQVGTADKKVEGTGLGLALSRKFIELHGGRISVESQMGAGSTFTFTIPVCRGE